MCLGCLGVLVVVVVVVVVVVCGGGCGSLYNCPRPWMSY